MKKSARRAVFDDAGQLYLLQRELATLQAERDGLEERIRQVERKLAEAKLRFDASYDQVIALGSSRDAAVSETEQTVTPGKLPHRVLTHMRQNPAHIYTASELQTALGIRDVQQVRTALARLVDKGLVRRMGVKGEFTI